MKKRVLLLAFQMVVLSVSGQTLKGIVVEADNRKPVSGVKVGIENTGIWTVTDQSGAFQITYSASETVVFSRAGLLEEKRVFTSAPSGSITVEMQTASIRIKEIMLSAKKKNYSEIEIKEEALKNIQAFSLNEVLEQIPGQQLKNLNLNEFKPIVFRSVTPGSLTQTGAEGFGNKSFGRPLLWMEFLFPTMKICRAMRVIMQALQNRFPMKAPCSIPTHWDSVKETDTTAIFPTQTSGWISGKFP